MAINQQAPAPTFIYGFTLNYTDPNTGANYPNAWFVMTNIYYGSPDLVNNYIATTCALTFDIYVDQQDVGVYQPVFSNQRYSCKMGDGSGNWETYFAPVVMGEGNAAPMTQAYACLQAVLSA